MSGPPYPRPSTDPTTYGIGNFQIGVTPIGGGISFDVWSTIINQYANSPILTTIITDFFAYLDQDQNITQFFDLIMNLDTAQGYGLDVWGRIVGVNRVLTIGSQEFFGFEQQVPTVDTFGPQGQSPLYQGSPSTTNYALSDAAFRQLIIAKAMSNICDGSTPAINSILLSLFPGRGNCYVVDGNNMTMQYYFNFLLTPVESAIVVSSGVLPRPSGVSAIVVQV